jgi:hypothetical protein
MFEFFVVNSCSSDCFWFCEVRKSWWWSLIIMMMIIKTKRLMINYSVCVKWVVNYVENVSDEFDLRMWECYWWNDEQRMRSLFVVDLCNEILFEVIHYVLDIFHLCCVYSLIMMIVSICSLHSILSFWATCSFYLDNSFCENFFYFVYVLRVILSVLNKIWFELISFVKIIFWWSWFQMNNWDYWVYFSRLRNVKFINQFVYLFDDLDWFKTLFCEFSVREIWLIILFV